MSAHARVTASVVPATFRHTGDLHGYPASTLTDGMVSTVRIAGFGLATLPGHQWATNSRPSSTVACAGSLISDTPDL